MPAVAPTRGAGRTWPRRSAVSIETSLAFAFQALWPSKAVTRGVIGTYDTPSTTIAMGLSRVLEPRRGGSSLTMPGRFCRPNVTSDVASNVTTRKPSEKRSTFSAPTYSTRRPIASASGAARAKAFELSPCAMK